MLRSAMLRSRWCGVVVLVAVCGLTVPAVATAAPVSVNLVYTFVGFDCGEPKLGAASSRETTQLLPAAVVTKFVVDDSVLVNGTDGFTGDFSDLLDFELVVSNLPIPGKSSSATLQPPTTTTFTETDLVEWVVTVDAGEITDINFFMWEMENGVDKSDTHRGYDALQRPETLTKAVNVDGYSIEGQEEFLLGVFLGEDGGLPLRKTQQVAISVGCFQGQYLGLRQQAIPALSGIGIGALALLMVLGGILVLHRRGVFG